MHRKKVKNYNIYSLNNRQVQRHYIIAIMLTKATISPVAPQSRPTPHFAFSPDPFSGHYRGLHECWMQYFETPRLSLRSKLNSYIIVWVSRCRGIVSVTHAMRVTWQAWINNAIWCHLMVLPTSWCPYRTV